MIGTMLGNRYELLEQIGEGGMALVYKAKCHLLNRYVAVKILKKQFSNDTEFVEKFKREATAAASLSDNNIVNIYDVGSQGDTNYIVMEYVKGKTLKQIIQKEGKLEIGRAANLAIQIGKALDCAHRNNIIHRDIKPHNILVTDEGLVKVTDFGIAKASNSVTITNSSKIMGSAHYFSPEQARGSFVDCRTDIYSLGIVIYEMVTGRVPYDADSPVSVALKHIQEPVLPPKELNENIPESLNKLILKAVEKEPIKRYENVKDMLVDLKKIEDKQDFNVATNSLDNDMTRVMDPVVINDKHDYEEDDDEPLIRKGIDPAKRKTIMGIAIGILVVVLGIISGYFAFSKIATTKETIVPNIVGMKQEDAKKAVEDKNLKFVLTAKQKSDKPEGTVLTTYPLEGKTVPVNSEVRVVISGGQDTLQVPNLVGVDLASAKDIIANSGLKLGNITYGYSNNVAKDSVISQSPDPDSKAGTDTKVSLVVSRGPEAKYTTVPDVSGKNIDEAAAEISNAGLKVSKAAIYTTDKSQEGKVTSQSVEPSHQVKQGTTVTLSYYKYKQAEINNGEEENNGASIQKPGEDGTIQASGGKQQDNGSGQNTGSNTSTSTSKGTSSTATGGTTEKQQTGGSSTTTEQKSTDSNTTKKSQ